MDLDVTLYDCFLGYLQKVYMQGCLRQVGDYRLLGASSYSRHPEFLLIMMEVHPN